MQKVEDTINALCEIITSEINKPYEYQDIRGIARTTEALAQLIRANTEEEATRRAAEAMECMKGEFI